MQVIVLSLGLSYREPFIAGDTRVSYITLLPKLSRHSSIPTLTNRTRWSRRRVDNTALTLPMFTYMDTTLCIGQHFFFAETKYKNPKSQL